MRFSFAVSLLPLAVSVGALSVTYPEKGDKIDLSSSFTVKWDSVDTDPSKFDLYLVNNAVYPNVEKKIATDVDSSKDSYDVSGLSGLTDGKGYQINLVSNEGKNTGILAQSEQFNGEGSSESSSSTSSAASTTGTSTASKSETTSATQTTSVSTTATGSTTLSTKTASSTASASASAHASASGNGTSTAVPTVNAAASYGTSFSAAGLLMGAIALNL
ncbi:Ser-Thr-rich glycosyl-phosphatidyl-inositol-anchored membrane family-domain-containing protein [Aspergillus avenaceus]|uniref:Ser-Thr-rich glycosyl-phosphatidyl-inositol-anchored membrane family-domain-containing protein n=1 Tax=Aspergillus avenaceus TaxID=36643 RepID=A0A5N6U913_ASPAV|nr:Ser-Thr-rich glycosyl-phosphatidyl-inositol-anchored membrane family-domain-containing protein [Aspergillus avenaceus]